MENNKQITMSEIVKFAQQYGFIFPGSEIYGGLANTWDYGPLGIRLKNNIKDAWRYYFIQNHDNAFEIDADILMNPRVWEASGHVQSFSDPLIDCKECKTRHRVDNLISDYNPSIDVDAMTEEEMMEYIYDNKVPCPKCGKSNFTSLRNFNLMFQTQRGVTTSNQNTIYLRPENAQGEYVNYLNVLRSMHTKLPFSIGQIGKAFRNEITPGNFTFRTIEFEQMEYQTFCKPGMDHDLYEYYKNYGKKFFESLGLPDDKLRFKDHEKLAHYAKEACDIEYLFPFGWGEINGTHNRTDFDLSRHQEYSGKKMEYFDPYTQEKYIPYIIESTYGLDRTILALLCESLHKFVDENGKERFVLSLDKSISPMKVSVLPLEKKNHSELAMNLYRELRKEMMAYYDDKGNIGKRYKNSDAIGTPYSICVDNDTLENGILTIRDRDTREQIKVSTGQVEDVLKRKLIRK